MKILKLEFKNIFSYGDEITTIEFGEDAKLWQLSGKSGSGKSSLLSIPKLLLFGKTEGSGGKPVKVANIANWINKKGWIRGTIKKGNDLYVIERTFAPSGLSITKNGVVVDRAGIAGLQTVIDNEILDGMPYHIFANVMTLSLNNFKSFISMTPADKRLIIDKIFSLEIINKVHELVKVDMRDLGNAINSSNSQIYALEQTIQTSQAELDSMNSGGESASLAKMKEIEEKLGKVQELYTQQSNLYSTYYGKYTELQQAENLLNRQVFEKNMEATNIMKKIELFNQDKCPTCGTPFNSEDFKHLREILNEQYNGVIEDKTALESKQQEITESKNEYAASLGKIQENINKISAKQNELTVQYKSIEAVQKAVNESVSIKNIIKSTEESKKRLEESIRESNNKMKLLSIMEEMYSADGIKQIMMSSYIPTLNKEINETLSFLGFPYTLTFDNNFDATLQHMNKEIETDNLSTGEHKKVDIAVLCSILKMVKRKYPQINLVFLDETVSSLDYESSTDIIRHLKDISSKMGLNIFIVSHTTLEETLFDVHLNVEKKYGYSFLSVV